MARRDPENERTLSRAEARACYDRFGPRQDRLSPRPVGGCRPLRVARRLQAGHWRALEASIVVAWGIPSEVLVAERP